VTLPSRPLLLPRLMTTSSSLRMGMERTWRYVLGTVWDTVGSDGQGVHCASHGAPWKEVRS